MSSDGGEPRTLIWDALDDTSARGSLCTWEDGRFVVTSWCGVLSRARRVAARLRGFGVVPGTRVACVLTNSVHVVCGLLGVWLAGGVIASVPLPSRGADPREYLRQLGTTVGSLASPLLLIEDRLRWLVPDAIADLVRSWESLDGSGRIDVTPPDADDVAFIQFSSGSTDMPKGCMLTSRAISRQLGVIHSMFDPDSGRQRMASWLPLSHDMGMFGCLLYPLVRDYDLVLSSPERFAMAPRTWFQDLVTFRSTITVGTNTGLHLVARAHQHSPLVGKLALDTLVVGAERVDLGVLRRTQATFAPNGLDMSAFMPAYGMAEATLAVTAGHWSQPPKAVALDAVALADGELVDTAADDPRATTVVSAGRPLAGIGVATADPGRLSEIHVDSPCLAAGYFADPVRTRERFVDGGFRSGDLGFVRDDELYVVGRVDDLLSVGGRKVYARELEATVDLIEPVRHGRSVVLDLPAGAAGELVLLVELKHDVDDYPAFAAEAARAIMAKAGVGLSRCLFLQRNTLPRTPSGKVQRFRSRILLLRDELALTAAVDL
ncbi:MAG TPA: AMP-binding protein [Pseudonocardiaceae bacterium]|nr:AMP-binding protein [Pseudonocardiaceae bacterium]